MRASECLLTLHSYIGAPEGASDEDKVERRDAEEEREQEVVGSAAGSTHHCAAAVLFLVM